MRKGTEMNSSIRNIRKEVVESKKKGTVRLLDKMNV